jgi:hypothetical protein
MYKIEFLQLVLVELISIREKATVEELDKLDFTNLKHRTSDNCIYGQMTGYCGSDRAKELFPKMFSFVDDGDKQDYRFGTSFTPLEKYLFMVNTDKHKVLIQYLKGEINIINL